MTTVHTIGHSTRTVAELIELLRAHGVEHLVDVRRFPGSRRQPQFGKEALRAALPAAGIGYSHEEDLGGRRGVQPDSPNGAWRNRGFRGYADYMGTAEFGAALERLIERARECSTAILCAEAVPWRCHRNLIADALVSREVEVRHILSADRSDVHRLNPAARVLENGVLVYPGGESQLDLLG